MANPRRADTPVDTILQGSTPDGRSSKPLTREGVVVERRSGLPLERGRTMLDHHYMLAWEQAPVVTEQAYFPAVSRPA